MSDWRKVRVADIATTNGLAGGPFGSSLGTKDYTSTGIPVIRGANLATDGRFNDKEFVYVSPEKVTRHLSRNIALPGDVVFTQRGTLGQVGIVPPTFDRYVISQSQMRLRVDPILALAEFIYYQFKSPEIISTIHNRAITTGVPHINLGILAELEIDLPSIGGQQAICQLLGALDDKIAVNDRIAATCHNLAQAITSRALPYSEPAPLGELADITMGSSPPGETYNESGVGVPFYQGTRDFGLRFPRLRVWCTTPARMAKAGDTLVSVRAPVGRLNIAMEDCCIGRGVAALASKYAKPSTLFHSLAATSEAWLPFESEGTVFGAINKKQLANLRFPNLCEASDDGLEERLASLDERLRLATLEGESLAALRDTLLPKLMSGEIRVREAEKAVEEAT